MLSVFPVFSYAEQESSSSAYADEETIVTDVSRTPMLRALCCGNFT
jgi:hypothetical protein